MSGIEQVSVDKRLNEPTRYYVNGHETTAAAAVEALIKLSRERERQAAARALREAANLIGGADGPRGGMRMPDEVEWAQWLHRRADRIEREVQP